MAQLELELPEEAAEGRAAAGAAPARRPRAATETSRPRRTRLRMWAAGAVLILAVIAIGLAFDQIDQFLASAPHFTLAGDAGQGNGSGLRIEGAVYASRERLRGLFASDFGRSVYLIPLEARRRDLLAVNWVRDARVSRHWPNRVVVRITERAAVAFVVLPSRAGGPSRMALIDAEGVILEPPARADFALPVLLGVGSEQPPAVRRERVGLLLRLLPEAAAAASQISEVDASDPKNLKVTLALEGRAVRLLLGDEGFRTRLENFLSHYSEIRRRLPQAAAFDLRLEGRITVTEGPGRGR